MKRVIPPSTVASYTMSAFERPLCGRASGAFSTITARIGSVARSGGIGRPVKGLVATNTDGSDATAGGKTGCGRICFQDKRIPTKASTAAITETVAILGKWDLCGIKLSQKAWGQHTSAASGAQAAGLCYNSFT